jgi:hypothetical protein
MSYGYRIEAGSPVDLAINKIVRATMEPSAATVEDLAPAWTLLDPADPGHMLALDIRMQLRRLGVTDPDSLVARLHAQWYGGTA